MTECLTTRVVEDKKSVLDVRAAYSLFTIHYSPISLMKFDFNAHTPPANTDTWHELKDHLGKVATLAEQFAAKLQAGKLGYYAGLWHDLGKYNPDFQKYLNDCAAGNKHAKSVPHAVYGAKIAATILPPLAPIIYGHHAGLPCPSKLKSNLAKPEYEPAYLASLELAKKDGILLTLNLNLQEILPAFQEPLSYELFIRLLFSCLLDADYLDTELHFDPQQSSPRKPVATVSKLWEKLENSQQQLLAKVSLDLTDVNRVRGEVYQACIAAAQEPTGVFRLAVPTGGGKTLSGLSFALKHATKHQLDRVIVAVPYTSIIEQTVGVYRDIFGEAAVLEHHSAAKTTVDNSDAKSVQAKARLATQNWDAPLIVTTTVQLFESLFHNKTSRCRKLHNLVNTVIILDEVQTLPIRLLAPIVNILQELVDRYHVTVVLCTATQPALAGDNPYLTGFTSIKDIIAPVIAIEHFRQLSRVNYHIPSHPWNWADVVADAGEERQGLVILNTRKDALELLKEFTVKFEDRDGIFHLSTLLCGSHRRQVLAEVRSRLTTNLPCWLISTQVVEAGVDLDFPLVYRALGPLDRIVQAAGRCNREGKRAEKGRVVIFEPQDGKTPQGEYATAVAQTKNLIQQHPNLDNPEIFQPYFRELYQGVDTTDGKEVQKYRAALNYPETAAHFQLIKDITHPVVIAYDDRARKLLKNIERYGLTFSDYQQLQPYLVSLRDREFKQSADVRREISPGIWLWEGGYDEVMGICLGANAIVRDPADLIL
jgi:CRISPR-associated endonuclease/helicase Cas3